MTAKRIEIDSWWGTFSLQESQAGRWRIGPSSIWLYRARDEWRVIYKVGTDPLDRTSEIAVPFLGEEKPWLLDSDQTDLQITRYGMQRTGSTVTILPALADRAVVVRPDIPLHIPQGETVSLFISTPLWMDIAVGSDRKTLLELPILRPSDTWFGPNTVDGEICYNTRTKARLRLEDIPFRHPRAVTPVRIRNTSDEALFLERIRIPVKHLSLFVAGNGFLWTELVTLDRSKGDAQATLELGEGPPANIPGAERVSKPREQSKSNLITRPFEMLFHKSTQE